MNGSGDMFCGQVNFLLMKRETGSHCSQGVAPQGENDDLSGIDCLRASGHLVARRVLPLIPQLLPMYFKTLSLLWSCAAAALISVSAASGQETVPVSISLEINQAQSIGTACYFLGPNSSNTQSWEEQTDYSGSLTFSADLDPSSAALSNVIFTSGEITTDGFSRSANVTIGGKMGLFTYAFSDVVRTVSSTSPDTPSSNTLNHARHGSVITRGSMSSSHLVIGEQGFTNETINLATTSDVLVKDETIFGVVNSGESSLTVQQLSGSLLSGQFRVNFQTAPGAVVAGSSDFSSVPVGGLPSGQSYVHAYKEEGTIVASATFTAPTAFGAWAMGEGLSLSTGLESNRAGISYRLLYSLDLPATASSVPITVELDGDDSVSVMIDVPSRGLTLPLVVLSNEGLVGSFSPVSNRVYQSRVKGLPAGRSTDARLIFPREDRRFFRLGLLE